MIEKVKVESENPMNERLSKLQALFPEIFTEGKVNLGRLRELLGDTVNERTEKYSFDWAGRAAAFKNVQITAKGTLVPVRESSINFDQCENVVIEGDNLEVLKLLQKAYFGKVRMIYIDPPYNTGKDFVYRDDFRTDLQSYLQQTGQANEEGIRLTTNPESNGRFHSDWLTMMYPRLFLARNLLRDDGAIFVSIDDNEVANLRLLMNEIFGEENFVTSITWRRTKNKSNITKHFSNVNDYILVYAKSKTDLRLNKIGSDGTGYNYEDERGAYSRNTILDKKRGRYHYDVVTPKGQVLKGPWIPKQEDFEELRRKNLIHWSDGKNETPYKKKYFEETGGLSSPDNFWDSKSFGSNQDGSFDVERIFGINNIFDYPKPVKLMRALIRIGMDDNDLIMDFFAGSGSTAHAVLEQNHEDGGNRKFILVQIPELINESSVAYKAGYKKVSDILEDRLRRVITQQGNGDIGFKVFRLTNSNFRIWNVTQRKDRSELVRTLTSFTNPLIDTYNSIDVIYECAIKEGYSLNCTIRQVPSITQNTVYRVDQGDQHFHICLDNDLSLDTVEALNLTHDDMFICLDEALDDSMKANLSANCRLKTI